MGDAFAHECLLASTDFCRLLYDRLDTGRTSPSCSSSTAGATTDWPLPRAALVGRASVNELKATRRCDDGTWRADISYRHYAYKTRTLLVGDTVATGVSAQVALEDYFSYHVPKEIIFFTICGGIPGARRDRRDLRALRGAVDAGLRAGSVRAGRRWDRPALPAPDTVTAPRYLARAAEVYGGKQICAIGDWASAAKTRRPTWLTGPRRSAGGTVVGAVALRPRSWRP